MSAVKKTTTAGDMFSLLVGSFEDGLDGLDHLNKYQGLEEFFSSVTK